MTNYRIFRLDSVSSGSATIKGINSVDESVIPTGSTGLPLDKVWGVIKDHDYGTATITLAGGGSLSGTHMVTGYVYPCHPIAIKVSSGSFSLLS